MTGVLTLPRIKGMPLADCLAFPQVRYTPSAHAAYVYVLRLDNDGFYVGSTRRLHDRLLSHFTRNGSIATRQCRPVAIERIYRIRDDSEEASVLHQFEVYVASVWAEQHGAERVRGGEHGLGWSKRPKGYAPLSAAATRQFFHSYAGYQHLKTVREIDPSTLWISAKPIRPPARIYRRQASIHPSAYHVHATPLPEHNSFIWLRLSRAEHNRET